MKSKSRPIKDEDSEVIRAFSHAFGGGSLLRAGDKEPIGLVDQLFLWLFQRGSKAYGNMVLRNAARQCRMHPDTLLSHMSQINNDGPAENISIGRNSVMRGILNASRGGKIQIGEEVYIGDNSCVYSMTEIRIGKGTMIAHDVNIFDNDTHHKDWALRKAEYEKLFRKTKEQVPPIKSYPVSIGEYCWIASGAFILKGCQIGPRSIISAGTIVNKDVPADSLAYGQESLAIRSLI